jgi:hypothetical protein
LETTRLNYSSHLIHLWPDHPGSHQPKMRAHVRRGLEGSPRAGPPRFSLENWPAGFKSLWTLAELYLLQFSC